MKQHACLWFFEDRKSVKLMGRIYLLQPEWCFDLMSFSAFHFCTFKVAIKIRNLSMAGFEIKQEGKF